MRRLEERIPEETEGDRLVVALLVLAASAFMIMLIWLLMR